MSFTPDFKPYSGIGKLRFWCQKVLPTIYDDSLSYYELLNKVVVFLNSTIEDVANVEDNLTALRDAFTELEQYVEDQLETLAPVVEDVIDQMIESGQFGDILVDAIAGVIADEYDPTESYVPLNYVLKDGKIYCCTANTTGAWDSTKWRETTVGDELNTLMQRVYSLNAGQVSYSESATYESGTVGKELKDLNEDIDTLDAGDVAFNAGTNYASGTVGNKLKNLTANDVGYNSSTTYNNGTVGKEIKNLNNAVNGLDAYIRNKKIAIFGDSWSDEDIQWSTTINDVWVKTFRTLCAPYNVTISNYSRSSRGWCRKDNRDQYTGLEIIANTDLTNIDTVIIFMGLNDFLNAIWVGNYNTTNTGRMWYALNQSVQYLTGKNVFVITPFAVSTYGSIKCATAELYRIVLANWATQNGYMLINGTTCPQCGKGSDAYESSHIKNAYQPIIAQHIFSKILQGGEPYNEMTEIASFVPTNPTISNITTVNEIAVQYHRNTMEIMVDVDITAENATASIQAPVPYISKFWQRYITINFNNHMMRTSMVGSEGGNDQSTPLCSFYFADASSGAYVGEARAQLCGAGYSTILGKPN